MKLFGQVIVVVTVMMRFGHSQLCEFKVIDDTKENTLLSDLSNFDRYNAIMKKSKKFNLLSKAKINDLFRLEKSGKLYNTKSIDREELCKQTECCCDNKDPCSFSLSVAVTSEALIEPRTFECRVLVFDVNDNAPQFPKDKITISIKESEPIGTTFQLPFATDLDSDKHSIKEYRLTEKPGFPPIFMLDHQRMNTNLNLQLIQKLDREKRSAYELVLSAIDSGVSPKTGNLLINIEVLDVNDNPPVLLRKKYVINQEESKFSTEPLVKIDATDEDENENAQLFFRITDENPTKSDAIKYFRIEQNTGKIFLVQQLDFEKQEKHSFFVEVSNNVGHVETATATVVVKVENVNDERPVISIDYLNNNNNHANIKENDSRVKFVTIVTVSDKDKGIGGQVFCRLMNFNDVFEIQSKDGSNIPNQYNILTKISLNRESVGHYELQMECEDKGYPVLKEMAYIKINVDDVNDNRPIIKLDNKISVKENQPPGIVVTQVTATDLDEGRNGELTYSISDSDDVTEKYLEINPMSGELKTRLLIDREQDPEPLLSLSVVLTVTDKGEPPLSTTAMFFVNIEDVNDNAPEFSSEFIKFSISENQLPRYTLGEISVTDRDDTSQLKVSFSLSPNDVSNPFIIFMKDNKFYLNTTRSLDWEKEQNFSFKIIASDGRGFSSHSATANLFVNVVDENDHAPTIIFPQNNSFSHKISYHEKHQTVVVTVRAVDRDNADSPNGKFYFQILDDHKDLFTINSFTGKITTTRTMTGQDVGKYQIKVLVRDQGSPPKESYIRLTIEVDDSRYSSRTFYHEDDVQKYEINKKHHHNFLTKEGFLVTCLIILLLFLLLCIFMILYIRHVRGLFPALPDIFESCNCVLKTRTTSKKDSAYNTSISDIKIQEPRNFTSRKSSLDVHQQLCVNEAGPRPLILNKCNKSNQSAAADPEMPTGQFRQYETMKYQNYIPMVFNSRTAQNCNYDQLFYHHSPTVNCEDSFIFPLDNYSGSNNFYDSRIKTFPNNLTSCNRIINNIDPSFVNAVDPKIVEEHSNSNNNNVIINNANKKKDWVSSNPCLKSYQSESFKPEPSPSKTPDMRRHSRKHDKIDTYAVRFPKEQSTFV